MSLPNMKVINYMSKKTKNLFRVDLNLKYLVYTDKEKYTQDDVFDWIKNEVHSNELDADGALEIEKVESSEQIQDFLDMDIEYYVYYTDGEDDSTSIDTLVEELGLDASALVDRLKKLGYTVTPPTKK
jgi:hypothetical protein